MPYAGVNGRRFYYEVGGEGDTIVLLHGTLASADLMEAPATALASGFRALRLDRRGHGRSGEEPQPYSPSDEAADVAALLDWLSVEKAHLLTHDDGSEVAIQFALEHPERTLSLAFLAPTIQGFPWTDETALARRDLLQALKLDGEKAIEEKWLPLPIFDVLREHEAMFERVADMYRRARRAGGSSGEHKAFGGRTQIERLGEIATKTAVLVGGRDTPDRLLCAARLVQGIHGAEGTTFPEASRFLHIEESRAVMRRLTDFYIPEDAES